MLPPCNPSLRANDLNWVRQLQYPQNHCAAVSMYVAFYNLCRTHETLRTTPAVALGIADRYCRLAIYWMRLCVPKTSSA
jgi:hypothetical protein